MSIREEKVSEVMERAKNHGLRLEFRDGLTVANRTEIGDREKQDAILAELAKRLSDVRRLVERRAIGAAAKEFIGQRIWATERGPGTLTGAAEDGVLAISISEEMRRYGEDESSSRKLSIIADAQSVLIVVDDAPVPAEEEPVSETPRKRLFGLDLSFPSRGVDGGMR